MRILTKSKTVDGIMSAFSKTIADLETVKQESIGLVLTKREEAHQLNEQADHAAAEATRAGDIANNLRAILGTA